MSKPFMLRMWLGLFILFTSLIIGRMVTKLGIHTSTEIMIVVLLVFIGFVLVLRDSIGYMPYVLAVWAVAPELRRVVDWSMNEYTSLSLIALAPFLVSLLCMLSILKNVDRISPFISKMMLLFAVILAYGMILGITKYTLSAVFELLYYVVPFLMFPYLALRSPSEKEKDGLVVSYIVIAFFVSLYGIIQFIFAPPWDVFWMNNAEMMSIGSPVPYELRVFSTLNSPGPAAAFLFGALIPMLLDKRWRSGLGWIAMLIIATCLVLTLVRSVWIGLIVTVLLYLIWSTQGQKLGKIIVLVFFSLCVYFLLPFIPGSEMVEQRFNSLTSLEEDHSYTERMQIAEHLIPMITGQPLGKGLGSQGKGTKLNNEGNVGEGAILDNGVGSIFVTYGVIIGSCFFIFLLLIWLRLWKMRSFGLYPCLGIAMFSGSIAMMISDNSFVGVSAMVTWFYVGLSEGQ